MCFTENSIKLIFIIPMLTAALLIPHGRTIRIKAARIKTISLVLVMHIIVHAVYQNTILAAFNVDRTILEFIGVVACMSMYIDGNGLISAEDSTDAEVEQKIDEAFYKLERYSNALQTVLIASSSAILQYQPLILMGGMILENVLKALNVNYFSLVRMAGVVYGLLQMMPQCSSGTDFNSQVVTVIPILLACFTVSKQVLLKMSTGSTFTLVSDKFSHNVIKSPEGFIRALKQYPNMRLLLDKGWPFILPFPFLISVWVLGSFKSSIPPAFLGLLSVFSACTVIVHVYWDLGRFYMARMMRFLITILALVMLFDVPSEDRAWKTFLTLGMIFLSTQVESIYRIIGKETKRGELKRVDCIFISGQMGVFARCIRQSWEVSSPFVSAFLIATLTVYSLSTKHRLVILGLSCAAALFIRSEGTLFWFLIEAYVVVEQAILLFMMQNSLPAVLTEVQFRAVMVNVAILFVAELQRLRFMPSIFRWRCGDKPDRENQVHPSMDATEDKIAANSERIEEEYYKESILWAVLSRLGRLISVCSILVLMGALLFYPQLVDVTFETCVYSIWAALFVFLFYRPKVTAKLRLYFIALLAILSGVFLVRGLYEMRVADLQDWRKILLDSTGVSVFSEAGRNIILHAAVFWLSCCSIFVMDFAVNVSVAPLDTTQESQESTLTVPSTSSTAPIRSLEASPVMIGAKLVMETGAIVERLFVVYWTRTCALLAFLAASFNPSIFGAVHLLIGCSLVWKNILSASLYVPMILWLLCATFLPAILHKVKDSVPGFNEDRLYLLVGEIRSIRGTVCLTAWALILFMQPLFMRYLMKLTSENERNNGLVNFQILPSEDEDAELTQRKFESFENSVRYYLSNWFMEFHNEIMVAGLIIVTVIRRNTYGLMYALLTLLHVVVPMVWTGQRGLQVLANTSFTLQIVSFLAEYCLGFLYRNGLEAQYRLYEALFGLKDSTGSLTAKSVFGGVYILLTVRWYLTSSFYEREKPQRRFDTHWCRLCGQVSHKSQHAYSRAKHNIHLYLGWAAHAMLFMTAITAYKQPTLPAFLLLVLSLVFFFYGEASVLMPNLRNQVYVVLGILLFWTLSDSLVTGAVLIGQGSTVFKSQLLRSVLCYLGLTNFLSYWKLDDENVVRELVFGSYASRFALGLTVFLVLLQIRLYHSRAWPFVLARMYHSYATAAKRAQIFAHNLQATISYQQRNLDKAADHVKRQMASFKSIDITDWKKLCYNPSGEPTEPAHHLTSDNCTVRERRNTEEFRNHLNSGTSFDERGEIEHLDGVSLLNLRDADESVPSLAVSDEAAHKEKLAIEQNFYWYTWIATLRAGVKMLISASQEYRRLQNRPSKRVSLKILFHHANPVYRMQFLAQLLFDVVNSNFDYVIDGLVMEAQVFHYSGFSLFLVMGMLLVGHLQRPFTSKRLNSRLIVVCALWILFNYCKVVFWKHQGMESIVKSSELFQVAKETINTRSFDKLNRSIIYKLFGIHIAGSIQLVTLRPTLVLLALSYKRSLMRHLGLWDYGQGIQMARIYYQTEEDLDEVDELNVSDGEAIDIDDSKSDFSSSSYQDSDLEMDNTESSPSIVGAGRTWKELAFPTIKMPWRDYYVAMFVADFACLFFMMVYWGDFTLGPTESGMRKSVSFFSEMVNKNMIPAPLVNMVLLSTFVLVLDRALYVSKNFVGKFLLQLATLVGYHVYMFFYLPQFYTHDSMANMFGFKLWYASKWVYWISSGLQLKYNFPPLRTEPFLGSQYGIVSSTLHNVYRSIPFIEELKTIIDWSMTPSALGLWPWLKFSDIFERLYAVQCARAFQGTYYGRHQFGRPFSQFSKICQGVVVLTLSILILWSPFLILSRSSMMSPNDLSSFKLEISVANHGPAFLTFARSSFKAVSGDEYDRLRYATGVNPFEVDPNFFTKITLPTESQAPWTISEQTLQQALKYLRDPSNLNPQLSVNWTVVRSKAQPESVLRGSKSVSLSAEERKSLADILDPSTASTRFMVARLSHIIPTLIKAPLTERSEELEARKVAYHLVRVCPKTQITASSDEKTPSKVRSNLLTLKQLVNSIIFFKTEIAENEFSWDKKECQFYLKFGTPYAKTDDKWEKAKIHFSPIDLFVYSSKLPKYSFSSFNLVGLYATVVFTVAQLFRMMHADMTTRIQYDDLPNPAPLLVMCQQILMMRELGDFESEEAIYWQLIEILRNPQLLIEITKK